MVTKKEIIENELMKEIVSIRVDALISDDIIRSHCPTYMPRPYGTRTRLSSCAAIGLIDPPLFFLL